MTDFGKIKSYDSDRGTGSIAPDKGGDALPFRKTDMQQQGQEPQPDQRFGYDVKDANNGKRYAINLQPQQGESDAQPDDADVQKEQARNQQG